MRFLLEQDGNIISISRDFRRYIVRPRLNVVYTFNDEGIISSKHQYKKERLDQRDDSKDDLREYCMVIEVGDKLAITPQEKEQYGTVKLN